MGINADAAAGVEDILSKEGQPCIFTATDGITFFSATVQAVPSSYTQLFDEGFGGTPTVSKTARCMVSERALVAAGYPVRNTAGKVNMKGHRITFEDNNGEQVVFVIAEQYPNQLTGLIRLQLNDFVMAAPPGRTIIGWKPCIIRIQIVTTPNISTQTLINGDTIPLQYAVNNNGYASWESGETYEVGDNVNNISSGWECIEANSDVDFDESKWTAIPQSCATLTIPYIAGYNILTPFMLSDFAIQGMSYNSTTGTFDNSPNNGFFIGTFAEVNAVIPIFAT
jgi:hypothetical protein